MEFKEETKKEKSALEYLVYFLRHPIKSTENFIWKAMNYGSLSRQHTDIINKYTALHNNFINLTNERDSLLDKVKKLGEDIEKYRGGIQTSLEYKLLGEAKEKVEAERDDLKKQLKNKNNLIDLSEAVKKELIKSRNSLLREKAIGTLIEYFKKNFSTQPYVFIDPETAKIIDYTAAFKKELDIKDEEELKGQSYLTILDGEENIDKIRHIKKFFKDNKVKDKGLQPFYIEYEKAGKKIPLNITIKPTISVDLPLKIKSIAKEDIKTIACVPLLVEKLGKWKKTLQHLPYFHGHSLDEVMEKTEEEEKLMAEVERETPQVHALLIKYNWKTTDILKIENKMGTIQSYLYFKKILYELEAKAEKAAKEEEEKRKAERKKAARKRLKKLEENPRRIENMINRLVTRGLNRKELEKIAKDQKLFYQDIRDEYAKMAREYKNSPKRKKPKKHIFGFSTMKRIMRR